jgi:hypothetical protein
VKENRKVRVLCLTEEDSGMLILSALLYLCVLEGRGEERGVEEGT